jgi:hypothetical protein
VVFAKLEESLLGLIWDIGKALIRNFDWLTFIPPLWSPSLVLPLVSEPVWSLVRSNRLYDPKVSWRKVS